jgi:streptomycin 6-kinase
VSYPVPAPFAATMAEVYGAAGVAWVADLPALIAAIATRWALRVGPPFPNLSYNYVAPATRGDGAPVVLKLGVPNPELASEAAALRWYAGAGAVRLLDDDPAVGALLLERLLPGAPLLDLADDAAATAIAADVMRALWRPPPAQHSFRSVGSWAAGLGKLRAQFDGGTGPLPAALVARAEALFADLLGSMAAPVLLHGDLHHENILRAERAPWLALDPKGVTGEPAYEIGAFLRNPIERVLRAPDPARLTARRIAQFADLLALDAARIRDWALAQAVLSAWWSVEDHGHGWEPAIAFAEVLADLSRHYP